MHLVKNLFKLVPSIEQPAPRRFYKGQVKPKLHLNVPLRKKGLLELQRIKVNIFASVFHLIVLYTLTIF